jgi:hypothetical protein
MKNEITVKPLKTYQPPNVPTLEESRKNPGLLKKLPLRWRKKAVVIAAAGIMGAWAFAGCTSDDFRMHGGGSPPAPFYIVQFTEQEALEIIRLQLEAAGLNFDIIPSDERYLFDSEKNVAISYLSSRGWEDSRVRERIITDIEKENIIMGFFNNLGTTSRQFHHDPSEEEKAEAYEIIPVLEAELIEQIDNFIEKLKAEGIL